MSENQNENQTPQVEPQAAEPVSVDLSEVENATKQLQTTKTAKADLEKQSADVPETNKYSVKTDSYGNNFWVNNENGEEVFDKPADVDAKIRKADSAQMSAFEAAIKVKETEIGTSRQMAQQTAERVLKNFANNAFQKLDDQSRELVVNDVVNSQLPKLLAAIDSDTVDWGAVSSDVAQEIEKRTQLLHLREAEQTKIDEEKKSKFPLEVTPMTNVQGNTEIHSHKGWTRAQRDKWISGLAQKYHEEQR